MVLTPLKIFWIELSQYFCAASETARDVAQSLAEEPIGSLPRHPLEDLTMPDKEALELNQPKSMSTRQARTFLQLLEVYVDDFVQLAQSTDTDRLRHLRRALLHGIHSVFPPPETTGHNGGDPVPLKKLLEGDGVWAVRKEILGWIFGKQPGAESWPKKR